MYSASIDDFISFWSPPKPEPEKAKDSPVLMYVILKIFSKI